MHEICAARMETLETAGISHQREYGVLSVWARLTKLDREQIGPAIMPILEGEALRITHGVTITIHEGVDAASLDAQVPLMAANGVQNVPACPSGREADCNQRRTLLHLDDQDLAWMSMDKLLCITKSSDVAF